MAGEALGEWKPGILRTKRNSQCYERSDLNLGAAARILPDDTPWRNRLAIGFSYRAHPEADGGDLRRCLRLWETQDVRDKNLFYVGTILWAFRPGSRKTHNEIAEIPLRNERPIKADDGE